MMEQDLNHRDGSGTLHSLTTGLCIRGASFVMTPFPTVSQSSPEIFSAVFRRTSGTRQERWRSSAIVNGEWQGCSNHYVTSTVFLQSFSEAII